MYLTYVCRPHDGPEGRGPEYKPIWDGMIEYGLRSAFGVQLVSVIALGIASIVQGSIGNIYSTLDAQEIGSTQTSIAFMFFVSTFVIGSALLAGFRNSVDDDSAILHSRGFRAGTKAISTAATLDLMSWIISFFGIYGKMNFGDSDERVVAVSMLFTYSRGLHVLALFFYAAAVFLLEVYHDSGVGEAWGWIGATFFKITAILEFVYICTPSNGLGLAATIAYIAALLTSFLWSTQFEEMLNANECQMTECNLRNEFYRSKNAMAYFGPGMTQPGQVEV